MKELFILAVLVMAILIYEIIQAKKENKILRNNYNTALKILSDSDPKLKEYLENKNQVLVRKEKMTKDKIKDNIILFMISFFINEMTESGITTDIEIQNYFNESNEKEFKKKVKEYKKIQSLTRTKAIKKITELKKDINNLKSDIKISK